MGLLAVVSGPGCKGSVDMTGVAPVARSCTQSSDCSAGQRCEQGVCVAEECGALECQPGAAKCVGEASTRCELSWEDGCPHWTPLEECGPNARCVDGRCLDIGSCTDECQEGLVSCTADKTAVVACQRDPSGCFVAVVQEQCGPHQVCEAGQCVCRDSCQPGETRCTQTGEVQTCEGPDGQGCGYWGAQTVACGPHQVCEAGQCRCQEDCTVGTMVCTGTNTGRPCMGLDEDGCPYLGAEETCYADMVCDSEYKKCMPHTDTRCYGVNECLYYGQKKCMDENYYGNCVYGDDGCLHWDCTS